jgi:hypothetical protein
MLYTVKKTRRSWCVRYIEANQVKVFNGSFGDPGEASQEFQACIGGEDSEYLEPRDFNARVKQIAADRQALAAWNQMSAPVVIGDMAPESLANLGIAPEQAKRFDAIIHQQNVEAADTQRWLDLEAKA